MTEDVGVNALLRADGTEKITIFTTYIRLDSNNVLLRDAEETVRVGYVFHVM